MNSQRNPDHGTPPYQDGDKIRGLVFVDGAGPVMVPGLVNHCFWNDGLNSWTVNAYFQANGGVVRIFNHVPATGESKFVKPGWEDAPDRPYAVGDPVSAVVAIGAYGSWWLPGRVTGCTWEPQTATWTVRVLVPHTEDDARTHVYHLVGNDGQSDLLRRGREDAR